MRSTESSTGRFVIVSVRGTVEERDFLKEQAELADMTLNEFCRSLLGVDKMPTDLHTRIYDQTLAKAPPEETLREPDW